MNRSRVSGFPWLSTLAFAGVLVGLLSPAASAQPTLNLPAGSVKPTVTSSTTLSLPACLEAQFPSLASGYDINSIQTYLSWCVQANEALDFSGPVPTLYSESAASYVLYNTYPNCDFVSRGANKNGIQDCGETGLNGVTVQLYQNSIAPGNLVATTTTGPVPRVTRVVRARQQKLRCVRMLSGANRRLSGTTGTLNITVIELDALVCSCKNAH